MEGLDALTVRMATGIDIIEISRIEAALTRWGDQFLSRVYTERELSHCGRFANKLAGRFAAKEAASKALGVGLRYLPWKDIEVLADGRGKPLIALHGRATQLAKSGGLQNFDVSIAHSRSEAIAIVLGWGPGEG